MNTVETYTPPEDHLPQEITDAYAVPFSSETPLMSHEALADMYEMDGPHGSEPTDKFTLRGLVRAQELNYRSSADVLNPLYTPEVKWKTGNLAVASVVQPPESYTYEQPPASDNEYALAA